MGRCTWQDPPDQQCPETATHPQLSTDKTVWADLCEKHHLAIEKGMEAFDAKTVLRNWVRAQGGSRKAAARMMTEF